MTPPPIIMILGVIECVSQGNLIVLSLYYNIIVRHAIKLNLRYFPSLLGSMGLQQVNHVLVSGKFRELQSSLTARGLSVNVGTLVY